MGKLTPHFGLEVSEMHPSIGFSLLDEATFETIESPALTASCVFQFCPMHNNNAALLPVC